ncbi:MAG: TRAP transporter small permease [Sphaerochaetaceae bacterium]|nr:TRAP transporter small permease [Sphaerochaetaceae bacterium]
MKRFTAINTYIEKILMAFCLLLLLAMVVSTSLQVISRYLFPYSISWTEEMSRRMMSWLLFLASPIAYRKGAQVGVDLFVNALSTTWKKYIHIIVHSLIAVFSVVMMQQGWIFAFKSAKQISSAINISMRTVYLVIPFSGFIILLFAIEYVGNAITGIEPEKELPL